MAAASARRQASGGDKPYVQPEVDDGTGRGGANGRRRTRRRRRGDREEAAGGVEVRVQQTGVRQRRPLKPPTWQQRTTPGCASTAYLLTAALQEGVYYVVVDQLGRQFSTQESL
ncbi:hypothetical protein Bbelb_394160 [Branchiostoma belcheri]|nr:hypothetical protein Bbelb_394160 [Branchiostoma belcheri]